MQAGWLSSCSQFSGGFFIRPVEGPLRSAEKRWQTPHGTLPCVARAPPDIGKVLTGRRAMHLCSERRPWNFAAVAGRHPYDMLRDALRFYFINFYQESSWRRWMGAIYGLEMKIDVRDGMCTLFQAADRVPGTCWPSKIYPSRLSDRHVPGPNRSFVT